MEGIITALATPFLKTGALDKASFKKLLKWQIEQNVSGFVLNGTTGESPCLCLEEVKTLLEWAKLETDQQILIVGVGGNCTKKTLKNIKQVEKLGVSACLAVVPYYNKPPQQGLLHHFKTLADHSQIPIILYNVPSRTSLSLSLETIIQLSLHPNVLGIKEASGDLNFGRQIISATKENSFVVLSGDDETCFDLCSFGAKGVISVASHLLGKEMNSILKRMNQENQKAKTFIQEYKKKYGPLLKSLYSETNPIGIKMALKLLDVFQTSVLRSPLVKLNETKTLKLKKQLEKLNWI